MRLKRVIVETPEINMTPVIDCVFQLMIFFLIATQVKKTETSAELVLPFARMAEEVKTDEKPPIIVNILKPEVAKGKPFVVGGKTFNFQEFKIEMKQRQLYYKQMNKEMPVLRVRADKDSQLQQIQEALIGCRDVGIWQVRLTAIKISN